MRLTAIGAALAAFGVVLAARHALDVVEVRGLSMAPALLPGDRLLVARLRPRVGDVVLARDPRTPDRELVKRVAAIDAAGVHLRGDNPAASTDARAFGAVPASGVRWRAILRTWPAGRFGWVPSRPAFIDQGGESACPLPEALLAGGVDR